MEAHDSHKHNLVFTKMCWKTKETKCWLARWNNAHTILLLAYEMVYVKCIQISNRWFHTKAVLKVSISLFLHYTIVLSHLPLKNMIAKNNHTNQHHLCLITVIFLQEITYQYSLHFKIFIEDDPHIKMKSFSNCDSSPVVNRNYMELCWTQKPTTSCCYIWNCGYFARKWELF